MAARKQPAESKAKSRKTTASERLRPKSSASSPPPRAKRPSGSTRRGTTPASTSRKPSRPRSARDYRRRDTDAPHVEQAEAIVDNAAEQLSALATRAGHLALWVAMRTREELEDIYAEADALRQRWRD